MQAAFVDSPRKQVVRRTWNAPMLERIHAALGQGYFYWGLPGPQVLDIREWRHMIQRVVAFEQENPEAQPPRGALVELGRNLQLLDLPHTIYCGSIENTVLLGQDDDGQKYASPDELVTLFNLDFCNAISGQVDTREGRRCLRFQVLRHLMHVQQELATAPSSTFVLLLTVREHIHQTALESLVLNPDIPRALRRFLDALPAPVPVPRTRLLSSPSHVKAFVFFTLRTYCSAHAIETHFLPPVRYFGTTPNSPMMHFAVLGKVRLEDSPFPAQRQGPGDFLRRACRRATEDGIVVEPCGPWEPDLAELQISRLVAGFFG